jgi:hypothetical protein
MVIGACGGSSGEPHDPDARTPTDDPDAEVEPSEADAGAPGDPDAGGTGGVVPSNGAEFGGLEETGLVLGPPNGTFDTDAQCVAGSTLGNCVAVTRPDLPDACVCRMDELTVGDLTITGSRVLVIFSLRTVTVNGTLSVGGNGSIDGPGTSFVYANGASDLWGGAGGSYGTIGANGAPELGNEELIPIIGGMRGQDGCNSRIGGGGGGALQITAGERIDVTGAIDAGGGGGSGGSSSGTCLGGAGGGSGGAILIEAPAITVSGTVSANGGGGGGGGSNNYGGGSSGWDGPISDLAASGGTGNDGAGCPLYGYTAGGDGGSGAAGMSSATAGQSYDSISGCLGGTEWVGEGGGGGGVGRIRVNTTTGCVCAGTFSPLPTMGTVVVD